MELNTHLSERINSASLPKQHLILANPASDTFLMYTDFLEGVRLMQDTNDHDHSHSTHSAKCDEEGCSYVAQVHVHNDDMAVDALSLDLAEHNKYIHKKETDPEEIKNAVKAKMKITKV